MRRAAMLFALAWTVVAGLFIAFGPLYGTASSVASTDGFRIDASGWSGLTGVAGGAVLALLAVPVLLAAIPVLVRTRPAQDRVLWVAFAVIGTCALLGAMTIGLLYLPAAGALLIAIAKEPPAVTPNVRS